MSIEEGLSLSKWVGGKRSLLPAIGFRDKYTFGMTKKNSPGQIGKPQVSD
jgi:hypothetical protein